VLEGLDYGKLPGDWYGINNITAIMLGLNEKYSPIKNFKIC
jgi:hypothetical protein